MGRSYGEVFVQLQDLVHYDKLYEISVPRLCSHHIPEGFSSRLEMRIRYTVNSNSTELEQVVYKHQTSCRSGWQRGFSELNIPFYLSGTQSSFLLIHFRYGPNTCSHRTKVRHRTYPICDAPRSRSAGAASFRYSTETAPEISGGSRGGARGPVPLIFRPN